MTLEDSTFEVPRMHAGEADLPAQLRDLMTWFLQGTVLRAGAARYRFAELECYYSGDGHRDPFVHGHPLQQSADRFYFHRRGTGYVGGTYKGVDLTFGDGRAHGGLLVRGLLPVRDATTDPAGDLPASELIDGPNRCVEALLAATGHGHVRELDAALGDRSMFAPGGAMWLETTTSVAEHPVFYTARIGLTLKRHTPESQKERYLLAPYRALMTPRASKKGRLHLIVALYTAGWSSERIHRLTGSPRGSIETTIERFEKARADTDADFLPFIDKSLSSSDLAHLHGVWARRFG